jgi:hypothetical protein
VKVVKKTSEAKTPGTRVVENHRPLMNKLTDAQRQRLRHRAAALIAQP